MSLVLSAPADSRRLTAVAALLLAAGLGALSSFSALTAVTLVIGAALGTLIFRPALTTPLLLWTALAVPLGIDATRSTRIPAALLLSALALCVWVLLLISRRVRLPTWSGLIPLGLFLLFSLVAVVAGRAVLPTPLFDRPGFDRVQAGQLSVIVVSPMVLLIVASLGRARTNAIVLFASFAASVVLLAPAWISGASDLEALNARGMYSMWAGVLCWSLVSARGPLPGWVRPLALALFLLVVYRYFFVGLTWFSGWAPLFVAVAVTSLLRSRKEFLAMAALCALLVARFWESIVVKYSIYDANRPTIWTQHLDYTSASRLLGLGPAGQALFFSPEFAFSSHNNYIDVLAQGGVFALVSFCSLFICLAVSCVRAARATDDPLARAYLEACIGGLAGLALAMMQGDWVIPFAYNQTIGGYSYTIYSWICLGVGLGLCLAPRDAVLAEASSVQAAGAAAGRTLNR